MILFDYAVLLTSKNFFLNARLEAKQFDSLELVRIINHVMLETNFSLEE